MVILVHCTVSLTDTYKVDATLVDKGCAVIWIESLFLPRASEASEGSSRIYPSPKPLGQRTTLSTMPKAVLFRKNS